MSSGRPEAAPGGRKRKGRGSDTNADSPPPPSSSRSSKRAKAANAPIEPLSPEKANSQPFHLEARRVPPDSTGVKVCFFVLTIYAGTDQNFYPLY
jgi:hypothetical protein